MDRWTNGWTKGQTDTQSLLESRYSVSKKIFSSCLAFEFFPIPKPFDFLFPTPLNYIHAWKEVNQNEHKLFKDG